MLAHVVDEELQLVLLEPHHAAAFFAVVDANREHLRPWMIWLDGTKTVQDSLAFIHKNLEDVAAERDMALALRYRGAFVGTIGAHSKKHNTKSCEIGYWIAQDIQGRGLMTRAVKAFIHLLFNDYGFQRLTIRCAPENQRSRAIPERLGFTQEGTLRRVALIPGKTPNNPPRLTDLVMYSLLDDEYYRLPWAQKPTMSNRSSQ
jgi:ribosomal-protein-serine acetyltransferase